MNEWGIYIALYCVLLYTQSALQSCEGVSLQPPPTNVENSCVAEYFCGNNDKFYFSEFFDE